MGVFLILSHMFQTAGRRHPTEQRRRSCAIRQGRSC
uniref:Uncharacterized protein n=1 Tax=Anguilla anguilla TaxID=7936 RepID=A0A0E9QHB5_ANGAN